VSLQHLKQDFSVGIIPEDNSVGAQAIGQLPVAVDFPIEDQRVSSDGIVAGLSTTLQVDDGQAHMPQGNVSVDMDSLCIGTSMPDRGKHRSNDIFRSLNPTNPHIHPSRPARTNFARQHHSVVAQVGNDKG
jgi:hypothetical protein